MKRIKFIDSMAQGKISRRNVLRAMVGSGPAPAAPAGERPVQRVPFEGMRRAIADNMHASLQNAAQQAIAMSLVDAGIVRAKGVRLSYTE